MAAVVLVVGHKFYRLKCKKALLSMYDVYIVPEMLPNWQEMHKKRLFVWS